MAKVPLILIAVGVVIAIVGAVLVVISSQGGPLEKRKRPEARRSHQEIRELLEDKGSPIPVPTLVLIVGLLFIVAGIGWRSFRDFR